ncbi:MAG: HlyD family efflux transporter periplasmic adaptor subunit [Patescibacteria group bacterium]|nr:HlyD family efflux transporter periplasmic adaptor subunit [Patescibacteria group bacterium]
METSKTQLQNPKDEKSARKKMLGGAAIALLLAGIIAGVLYFRLAGSRVYDEDAQIYAPEIKLAPEGPGILREIYVREGDIVPKNFVVAKVGEELVKTKETGLVILAEKEIGKIASASDSVATIINPEELRVVARVEENKGLTRIKIGQRVIFTVDAFGSKEYQGVVDEIGASSRESALTFNISQQRPTQEFNVKIRFNISQYPELKNGMSAKVWIYR